MRILIAEDEVSIAKALQLMLEKNKYSVDVVHNGTDALVLDIMMPGMDGISVLTEARRRGVTTPALFLTAKSEVEDRIAGLDAGADDYLPKPFAAGEFLARVRALVRRSSAYAPDVLSFGGTTLDASAYILRAAGGEVRLNNKEFQLMELFLRHPRQIFSAERLMDKIWGFDCERENRTLDVHIRTLRMKLGDAGSCIETVRGVGYKIGGGV